MTVDCVNIALLHPLLAVRFVARKQEGGGELIAEAETGGDGASMLDPSPGSWFPTLAFAVLQFTPTCHHPKVTKKISAPRQELPRYVRPG